MQPTLRSVQFLRHEAEELGYENKDIPKYVKEQQALDRKERAAWRDAQKRQVDIRIAEIQAEEEKRADEIQAEEKKRADEIKMQMANIEAEKRTYPQRDGVEGPTSSSQYQCNS